MEKRKEAASPHLGATRQQPRDLNPAHNPVPGHTVRTDRTTLRAPHTEQRTRLGSNRSGRRTAEQMRRESRGHCWEEPGMVTASTRTDQATSYVHLPKPLARQPKSAAPAQRILLCHRTQLTETGLPATQHRPGSGISRGHGDLSQTDRALWDQEQLNAFCTNLTQRPLSWGP